MVTKGIAAGGSKAKQAVACSSKVRIRRGMSGAGCRTLRWMRRTCAACRVDQRPTIEMCHSCNHIEGLG